jgi:hypothetical protein
MIHLLLTLCLFVLIFRILLRLVFRPFRHRHRVFNRWGDGYANPYAYGYRRPGLGGQLLPIFLLVAIDRLFGRRYW